ASTEGCDDANTTNGDGCSSTCQVEPGATCTGAEPSVCSRVSRFNGKEYLFSASLPTQSWANAQTICQNWGGHLARIDDAREQQHLEDNVFLVDTWIGGQHDGSNWVWRDGSNNVFHAGNAPGTTNSYTHWDRGQPDGAAGQCAYLWGSHAYWWDNAGCGGARAYVCERLDKTALACGNRVVQGTEECDDGNTTPNDGCSSMCTLERGYFCSLSGGPCTQVCSMLGNSFSRFPVPAAGLPASTLATEQSNESNAAEVEYIRCATNALTALHAEQACRSFGAGWQLADISSEFENSLIAGQLSGNAWWVGGTDDEDGSIFGVEEGGAAVWRWRTGGALLNPVFSAWISSEPNNGGASH
ncbi:MAG: DUF4215 domain-containing protein, partial [Myxococcales bacterium]|nr:DUF4215 domain-containing protein [Myxococcales bacterium]